MKLDLNVKMTQEQRLIMTQNMQQSIKLLQMSLHDLREHISNEYSENPILEVNEDSLLHKNGIMYGDVITKINDTTTENVIMFQKELYSYDSGSILNLEYYRDNQLLTASIILE